MMAAKKQKVVQVSKDKFKVDAKKKANTTKKKKKKGK